MKGDITHPSTPPCGASPRFCLSAHPLGAGFLSPLAGGWCGSTSAGTRTPRLPALGPPSLLPPGINNPWTSLAAPRLLANAATVYQNQQQRAEETHGHWSPISKVGDASKTVPPQPPRTNGPTEKSPTQDPRHQHSITHSFTRVHGHLLARLVIRTGTLQTTTTAKTPREHDTPHMSPCQRHRLQHQCGTMTIHPLRQW